MPLKPLEDPIDNETQARVTEAVLTCRCPDGTYKRVKGDTEGRLVVAGAGGVGGDVTVLNWPSSYAISNWPTGFLVGGTVSVDNFPAFPSSFAVSNFPATQPVSIAAPVAVTGTFWPATQPVSIAASVAVTGTFWQATQPVSGPLTDVQLRAAPVPVSGTFWQATQPVSGPLTDVQLRAAAVPVSAAALPLPSGASTEATLAALLAGNKPATLCVTATAAVNTGVTCTLPAAGPGLFHYIVTIQITKLYSVVGVAAGAGIIITTTNLPGSPSFTTEQLASPAGTAARVVDLNLGGNPLRSSVANTNTTIVCPSQLQTIWRVNVVYYTGT